MFIRRTFWKGSNRPMFSYHVTDDFGNEVVIKPMHKAHCPVYYYLSQTSR